MAETDANILLDGFISRYEIPKQNYSDQGSQFKFNLSKSLFYPLMIDKTRIIAYHPQSNGFIGDTTILCYHTFLLSKLLGGDQRNSDIALPVALVACLLSVRECCLVEKVSYLMICC